MASLKDVAAEAGVSIATASMALRDHPRITSPTRRRVLAAAEELKYRPSALLRQAMSGMRNGRQESEDIFAVLYGTARRPSADLQDSLMRAARKLGYLVEFMRLTPDNLSATSRTLNARNVRGALLLEVGPDIQAYGPSLFGQRIHVVCVQDLYDPFSGIPRVGTNLETLSRMVVWHALQKGYRRPGLVHVRTMEMDSATARAVATLLRESLPGYDIPTLYVGRHHPGDAPPARAWLKAHSPDLIITDFPSPPREIGIPTSGRKALPVIHTDIERSWEPARRAGIYRRRKEAVSVAIHQLVGLMQHGAGWELEEATTTLLEPTWVENKSLPAVDGVPLANSGPNFSPSQRQRKSLYPCDLRHAANHRLLGLGGWFQSLPLRYLQPGVDEYAGIPFEILDDQTNAGRGMCLLASDHNRANEHGPLPRKLDIQLGLRARALYFLHACAWCEDTEPFARYLVEFSDGSSENHEIHGLSRTKRLPPKPIVQSASLHDWWRGAVSFETERVKPVRITAFGNSTEYLAYLYAFRWQNPHPLRKIKAVRMEQLPDGKPSLGLLALTAERTG